MASTKKEEIFELLDKVPQSALEQVLSYLKSFAGNSDDQGRLISNLRDILNEDKELLDKLAQ